MAMELGVADSEVGLRGMFDNCRTQSPKVGGRERVKLRKNLNVENKSIMPSK